MNGHTLLIAAHIDDFILACADRNALDAFRTKPLARFDSTYEGAVHTYLGCEVERDIPAGSTLLSQRHFAEDVLRTFDMWVCIPALTPMKPGTRLRKEQSNPSPDPAFHRRYRGIVGSLGYLVNMTRPDLAWSYSELSKYVQYPYYVTCVALTIRLSFTNLLTHWPIPFGVGLIRTGRLMLALAVLIRATLSCLTEVPSLGNLVVRIACLYQLLKPNMLQLASADKRCITCARSLVILAMLKSLLHISMKII